MWNLLHKNEDLTRVPIQQQQQQRKKPCWNLLGSYLCQRFWSVLWYKPNHCCIWESLDGSLAVWCGFIDKFRK